MYNRNIFFLIIFFALIATSSQGSDELLDLFGLGCYESNGEIYISDIHSGEYALFNSNCIPDSSDSSILVPSCIDGTFSFTINTCNAGCNVDYTTCSNGNLNNGCRDDNDCTSGLVCDTFNYLCQKPGGTVSNSVKSISSDNSDFKIVIGSTAKPADNIAAIDVSGKFGLGLPIKDNEVNLDSNLIVIGGPCVNSIANDLMNNPADCTKGFESGKGMIKSFNNSGKTQILIAGNTSLDTRIAARALVNYQDYDMDSNPVITYGTSLDDVNVGEKEPINYTSFNTIVINEANHHMWQAGNSEELAWQINGGEYNSGAYKIESCSDLSLPDTNYPACNYCYNLALCEDGSIDEGGICSGSKILHDDWRLPTGDADYTPGLDYSYYNGNHDYFKNNGFVVSEWYWIGTSGAYPSRANFFRAGRYNTLGSDFKNHVNYHARCVRDHS